jgi:hypothetical protein
MAEYDHVPDLKTLTRKPSSPAAYDLFTSVLDVSRFSPRPRLCCRTSASTDMIRIRDLVQVAV